MDIVMDILLGAWVFVLAAVLWNKLDELCELVREGDEIHREIFDREEDPDGLSDM